LIFIARAFCAGSDDIPSLLVERRRRDKINTWINKLAKVVPECCQEQSKAGQVGGSQNIVSFILLFTLSS